MRREHLLAVRAATFNPDTVRKEWEEIASCFGEYLSQVGARGRSKHRALGAVAKALQQARTVRGDALLGYARRVHEQTTDTTFPVGAVERLDEGLRRLDVLLSRPDISATARDSILERVEYATYYDVRQRSVVFQRAWKDFVRGPEGMAILGAVTGEIPWYSKKLASAGEPWARAGEAFIEAFKKRLGTVPVAALEEDE